MNRIASYFGRLLVLLIFLATAWLLYHRLRGYTFEQIRAAIGAIPASYIVAASLLRGQRYSHQGRLTFLCTQLRTRCSTLLLR